ncbi:MAG: HlyD family efflux transporter periplasmic adaptor subunit [Actinomycetota bacterium]|nr:HlyD family efflux transporter periplasmic adaptor subunit [Actinomycetota bacterium]
MQMMRTRALERRRMPDELDGMLIVAPARAWLALMALGLAIAGLVLWGLFGKLPHEVSASGMLTVGGLSEVQSTAQGQVGRVLVANGQTLRAGQPVVALTGPDGTVLRAPFAGVVENLGVAPGQVISVGAPLYTLQPPLRPGSALTVLLFLTPSSGATIAPGMRVNVNVASAPAGAYGVVRGKVASVTAYPASAASLTALLGNPDLAAQFSHNGPPIVAHVRLIPDRSTRSGLQWSTPHGPPFPLVPGVSVSAEVIQGDQTPANVLFGT